MDSQTEKKFAIVRKYFPVTQKKSGITYLNAASVGPLCKPVKEALDRFYEISMYSNKNTDIPAFADLDKIRRLGAKMIGARQDETGFGFHTNFGLNLAAFGLPLKKGDEVLLSDIEFPSNVYPWTALKERGIKVKFIKSVNRFFDIENFEKAISKKSKVLSLSFVQFFNGFKNDLKTIGEICKKHGLYFVVDGIQGCGAEPIDVRKCQIDILSAGGQKWLLSPQGTGIFFIKKDLQNKMNSPWRSWLSVDWGLKFDDLFHYDKELFDSARKFEMGTYAYSHVHAMAAALELIASLGIKNIQQHNHRLQDILIDFLNTSRHYRIVSNIKKRHRSSILSFTCDNVREVHRALMKSKIICVLREGGIRISVHLYNSRSDIMQVISILKRFGK